MLVKIQMNDQGEQLVSARALHEKLEVKSNFTTWIKKRVKKYGFVENVDFTVVSIAFQKRKAIKGGQNKIDYILKLDMAKEISMIENNDKGREIRQYFIECEKQYYSLAKSINEIEFNPRLRDIQKSVTKIKEMENQIRMLQKKVSEEYDDLSIRAKIMKDIINEGEIKTLSIKEYKKG